MSAVIHTQGLEKTYAGKKVVLELDLEVRQGEIFGFLGPNGAGKTTTILMLLGLTEPSNGTVRVLDMDPARNPLEVKRQVGYLPENMGFYPDLTARQNLRYVAELNGIYGNEADRRIHDTLNQVGLEDAGDRHVQGFSRGMQQRLGIAELLLKDPGLIILDEPTLGLDPDGIRGMIELIRQLRDERGLSVLLSSHLLHQVQQICDRVGILNEGTMVACGSMNELINQKTAEGARLESLEDIYMHYFHSAPAARRL
ncbi:MAG: ABC transporter ATP-binding protein [Desulfobacteraceae bacterium]|nr:ABC transporter ATP-binding protein [Desulfobacteraceae bacterium]